MINAKIWCPFKTTPRPFLSPDAFLSLRGRVQERGGQTQGVQRTPVGKPRVDHFGTFQTVSEPFRMAPTQTASKLFRPDPVEN